MIPPWNRCMAPVAPGKVIDQEGANLNVLHEICAVSGALLCTRPEIDSAASGQGWLPRKPRAGRHARPARRHVSRSPRGAGLLATKNRALGGLSRAVQTHPLHFVHALGRLGQPHRDFASPRFEMALRSTDRLSHETSKTGLRPVGRAAVAALGTGLRPVRSAPTGHVASRLHARPARRPVSGCRRRAGLLAPRDVALGLLSCAAQMPPPHIAHPPGRLGQPRRYARTRHLEMAFRSANRSSRETSKTGLRPVGRAAVAAFETGLRPVGSAPTGRVAIGQRARPARRPVSGCCRRAGLLATRTPPALCHTTARFPLDNTPPPARPSLHGQRGATLGAHSGDLETRRDFTGNPASTRALFLPATLTFFHDGPPNKRLVSDRAGRCAPVPAAQPQGVGRTGIAADMIPGRPGRRNYYGTGFS
jgi:hypothetical protein